VPPGQPTLVQCVFTMNENMGQCLLHDVSTELAIDQRWVKTREDAKNEVNNKVFFSIKQTCLCFYFCYCFVHSLFCLLFFRDKDEEKTSFMFKYSGYYKPWPKLRSA
jgi:hypothetical protein